MEIAYILGRQRKQLFRIRILPTRKSFIGKIRKSAILFRQLAQYLLEEISIFLNCQVLLAWYWFSWIEIQESYKFCLSSVQQKAFWVRLFYIKNIHFRMTWRWRFFDFSIIVVSNFNVYQWGIYTLYSICICKSIHIYLYLLVLYTYI